MSMSFIPSNLQYLIHEKLSKNNNKVALKIALGKQVNQKRNNRERYCYAMWPGRTVTRNSRFVNNKVNSLTGSTRATSPPYFASQRETPVLKGKLTQRMKTHLKKLRNGKTTMKRDTYKIGPENHYNIRVWNDTIDDWNYEEMNRLKHLYIAEENARVTKRRRQAARMNAIRKLKKKKRQNDIDHRALLSSLITKKKGGITIY